MSNQLIAQLSVTVYCTVLVAATLALGARLRQDAPKLTPGVDAFLLVLTIQLPLWIPQPYRDGLLVLMLFAVIGTQAAWVLALISAGGVALIGYFIPGGTAVLLLAGGVIAAPITVGIINKLLRAVARTPELRPGETPAGDVLVSGELVGATHRRPDEEGDCAMWQLRNDGALVASAGATLTLESKAGTVLVDSANVDLRFDQGVTLTGSTARAALERAGAEHDGDKDTDISLFWLEVGQQVVVIGTPRWTPHPAGLGGYRDSPVVPLFEGSAPDSEGKRASQPVLADSAEQELVARERYKRLLWLLIAPALAATLVVQILVGVHTK